MKKKSRISRVIVKQRPDKEKEARCAFSLFYMTAMATKRERRRPATTTTEMGSAAALGHI